MCEGIRTKRESELSQEEIAEAVFNLATPIAAAIFPDVTRDWNALGEVNRAIYLLQARWIINYGLDCRNAEKEGFLRKLDKVNA